MYNYNFEKGERQFQKIETPLLLYESYVGLHESRKGYSDSLNIEYQQFLKDINDNMTTIFIKQRNAKPEVTR